MAARNKKYFDLSNSLRPELKDNTNKKVLGKFKDEIHSLLITEFIALNPKVYSVNYQSLDEFKRVEIKNKKTLKGVSKVVVKNEIKHSDYVNTLKTNEIARRNVVSIRSFNHQLYTYEQEKIALTSFYAKMKMLEHINCVPCGCQP